jgi:hypothetical protein
MRHAYQHFSFCTYLHACLPACLHACLPSCLLAGPAFYNLLIAEYVEAKRIFYDTDTKRDGVIDYEENVALFKVWSVNQ